MPTRIPERCDRCGKKTNVTIMSFFNTQVICMTCKEKEKEHPDYERARRTEAQAVRDGDYNYPGVGLPDDLQGG